jgi:hypothetical protein
MRALKLQSGPADVQTMMTELDLDRNGTIEFNEFIAMVLPASQVASVRPSLPQMQADKQWVSAILTAWKLVASHPMVCASFSSVLFQLYRLL